MITTASDRYQQVIAQRRCRAELTKVRRSACPVLAAHAALARLTPWKAWLDWDAVVGQVIDAVDHAQAPGRWPGDPHRRPAATATEMAHWLGEAS